MGFTPHFTAGTAQMYSELVKNQNAMLMFGGGDTLQEFKSLLPKQYNNSLRSVKRYFFTGGGTILKVIQGGSPYDLEPVKALITGQKT
jgi:phosphoglycerate kinase